MKLWIVSELGIEYDDEYNSVHEDSSGLPRKAFKSKENALAEKKELESKKRESESAGLWYDHQLPSEFYRIDEVEVSDDDQ